LLRYSSALSRALFLSIKYIFLAQILGRVAHTRARVRVNKDFEMKNVKLKIISGVAGVVVSTLVVVTGAAASIVSVTGPNSSAGTAATIGLPVPAQVLDASAYNTAQQGFDEAQNVLLTADLDIDGGSIAAGTRVNSQMIFLNQDPQLNRPGITHNNVEWTFSSRILGIMSDMGGLLEFASSSFLGQTGIAYPAGGFEYRGMEDGNNAGDSYALIDPYTLSVSMRVTQPGDWIRVVTAVPLPPSMLLFGAALIGLGWFGNRKRKNSIAA